MKKILFLLMIILLPAFSYAQDADDESSNFNIGLGVGIDYGGFGGRLTYLPVQRLELLLGLGYNLDGFGYNVGAAFRFAPTKKVCPTFNVMYGYNGVIKIEGADQYNGTYYGPSIGAGLEIKTGRNPKNHFNVELLIPFRSKEFKDDWDAIKNNSMFVVKSNPLPVAFSIGYHFGF